MTQRKHVLVFTDGACTGNPGPGGWAAILRYGDREREISGGFRRTTNNRMELTAVIKALEALKQPCRVTLYTDSEYIANSISKGWARDWRAKGWRRKGKIVPNWDLWQRLLELLENHDVAVQWVQGHSGHEENERCDRLAVAAAGGTDLPADEGYEHPPAPPDREP
jgi:ribonuclease HI